MVRDMARGVGKQVIIEMIGEDTEIDKNLVDSLSDPMIHLIRNSIDHGVELPDERIKKGKNVQGLVTLKSEQVGNNVEITISDDGKGISPDFMRNICVKKNLVDKPEAELMTDAEALHMLFLPGFSTAEKVTDLSGRGVGMDVVKTTVERLNGSVSIDSTPDVGTSFKLTIPLTMAIVQALMVEVGEHVYAIPLSGISEIFMYDQEKINVIDGQVISRVRDSSVPIFYLDELLPPDDYIEVYGVSKKIITMDVGDGVVGVVVDHVLGQEEVVIKPVGAFLGSLSEYAGATITGDGNVALILDFNKLLLVS
jgi:two-component system chemotaxis sensor kinase CheA